MTGSLRLDNATIERARNARSLLALVARRVKLRRAGRDWNGLCPFHAEKTPSFKVSDEKGFYHCFGCGAHGSAIDWMMEAEGLDFRGAVTSLLGGDLPDARKPMPAAERQVAPRSVDVVSSSTAGRWIFRTSGPARGEIVERWLESRGLDPGFEPLPAAVWGDEAERDHVAGVGKMVSRPCLAIDQLRFHPRCPVSVWRVEQSPEDARLTAPAMVAPIADAEGAVWGVHVTYLSADGRSKAALPLAAGRERPTRKMFGKVGGNGVFLVPPLSQSFDPGSGQGYPLVVGEGIETVWSLAQGRAPCRPIATLSLENLQGQPKRLRDGSLPLWNVESDPDRRPFTLPDAGEVLIAVDADMKPLRDQKVQLERGGKPVRMDLGGLKRAEICAALASQAWRRAGASSVSAIRPRMGMDFNDTIRGRAAA